MSCDLSYQGKMVDLPLRFLQYFNLRLTLLDVWGGGGQLRKMVEEINTIAQQGCTAFNGAILHVHAFCRLESEPIDQGAAVGEDERQKISFTFTSGVILLSRK